MQEIDITELVEEHGRMVYGAAYRILGNREDAEDVYQETFLKASKLCMRGRRGRAIREWGSFLRVMATRRAIDVTRRNRTRGQAVGVTWIEELEGPDSLNPRQVAIRREQAGLIREAVAALPKQESMAFCLRYFEGLSYEDTATHLGASPNAVGVLLHRARRRLRHALRPMITQRPGQAGIAPQPTACVSEGSRS